MAGFRRISETLSKPLSSHPNPHILPQQTTDNGSLLLQEKGSERVPGELIIWFDLGIFTGIQQAHLEPSSPLYPASTNHR